MAAGSSDRDSGDDISRDARGDVREEIRKFLTTRRARISPEQAGLPRTAETADGSPVCAATRSPSSPASPASTTPSSSAATPAGVSESVIDGIARALQLDEAERIHFWI